MVDRQLIARLDAARVSFCLIGAGALAVHGCAPRSGGIELLAVDDTVLRPLFWESGPRPVARLNAPEDHVAGRLHWNLTPAHELMVGRSHAMVFAVDTSRQDEELGCRVATPLGLVLVNLDRGEPGSRADLVELIRAQESRFDRPWRPLLRDHLEHLTPASRTSWHQVELDLGAVT